MQESPQSKISRKMSNKTIFCPQHPNKEGKYMQINQNEKEYFGQPFKFMCKHCMNESKERSNNDNIIKLQHLLENSEGSIHQNDIIYNWPLLNNTSLFDNIQDILNKQDTTLEIINSIDQQYQEIKHKMNDQIDEYYKYLLKFVNQVSHNYIRGVYQKVSSNNLGQLRNWVQNYGKGKNSDIDTLQDIINEQEMNKKINTDIINVAISQFYERLNYNLLFETLNKKLDCLFEKMNSRFLNTYFNLFNLLEEQNENEIEKRALLSHANKLFSLKPVLNFQWKSFEEMENGILIKQHPRKVMFTKGYNMDLIDNNFVGLKKSSSWWIEYTESFSNQGDRYVNLNYNKKAKNYFSQGSQKSIYHIPYSGKKDKIKQSLQIAQDLQRRIHEIQQKSKKL